MGNVLAQESTLPAEEDAVDADRSFLLLSPSTIFNDAYLMEIFDKLPAFEGTIIDDETESAEAEEKMASRMSSLDALRQLQYALRDQAPNASVSVEAFPALSYDEKRGATVDDGYHKLMKMRSRLLQRVHLAMLRDFKRGRDANGTGPDTSNYMRTPPLKEDMSITMTAFAVRMSVITMRAVSQSNPALATEMCRNLMELLDRVDATVLQRVAPGSVAEDMMRCIIDFTKDAATEWGLNDSARGEALGLLLSLGTTRGNVGDIATVAKTMLSRPAPLPEHLTLKFARTIASRRGPAKLTIPEYGFANHLVHVRQVRRPEARAPAAAAAIATDGEYLYIFDPASAELIKCGTGFHGTAGGSLVQFSAKTTVPQALDKWRKENSEEQEPSPDEESEANADQEPGVIERCWLAVCNNTLYLKAFAAHKKCALKPEEVATLSLETLQVTGIHTIDLPIAKWMKAKNVAEGIEDPETILSDRMNLATSSSGAVISGTVVSKEDEERELTEEEIGKLVAITDGTDSEPFEIECKSILIVVTLSERAEVVNYVGGFFRTTAVLDVDESSNASEEDEEEEEENNNFRGAIDVAIAGDDSYFIEYLAEDGSAFPHDGFSPVPFPDAEVTPYDPAFRLPLQPNNAEATPGEGLHPKRVRFRLAPGDDAGDVVVGAITITGQERIVDDGSIPCPGVVSDGRMLQFPVLEGNGRSQVLKVYQLPSHDLANTGSLLSEVSVEDGCLSHADNGLTGVIYGSVYSNGDYLGIVLMNEPQGEEHHGTEYVIGEKSNNLERSTRSFLMNLSSESGRLTASNGGNPVAWASEPAQWLAAPDAVAYDPINNMVWLFDALTCRSQAFRNAGPAPRLYPSALLGNISPEEMLFCEDPSLRLKAIENTASDTGVGPAAQAAILMTSLEVLSERYAPPLKKVPAQAEARFEGRVVSGTNNRTQELSFFLRGLDIIDVFSTAGIYMLLLDESLEHAEGGVRRFSTETASNGDRMADFVDSIPEGRTVMVGVAEDGYTNLIETRRGKDALVALGVRREDLNSFAKGDAFACIGRKGAKPEEVKYRKMTNPNTASVSQRLPTPCIPFTLTPDSGTFGALTSILLDNWDIFTDQSFVNEINAGGLTARRCRMRVSVLLSTLNVVGVHIYQSLQGMAAEVVRGYVGDEAIPVLNEKLLAVIDKPPDGFEGATELGAAALRFFVYGIDLFYPTAGEQTALMVDYLQQHRKGELSQSEAFVLDMLIQRASRPETLQRLLSFDGDKQDDARGQEIVPGQKRRSFTSTGADLLDSLLEIASSEYSMQLSRFSAATADSAERSAEGVSGVGASAVALLSNVAFFLLSQSAQKIIDGAERDPWGESTVAAEAEVRAREGADMLVKNMASLCRNATDLCNEAAKASDAREGKGADLAIQVDQLLEKSPVGAMLPSLVTVVALLLKFQGSKLIDGLPDVVSAIGPLMAAVKKLLLRLPPERYVAAAGAGGKISTKEEVKVLESPHPYHDNMDTFTELVFAGAKRISIAFDEQSATESGYDWVRFYKDRECNEVAHPGVDKYSGRNGDQNFCGCGGRPPLVLDQDRVYMKFHTDGSNVDWGWKVTFTAEIDVQETAVAEQAHWLLSLDRHLANCGGQVSASLIKSLPWGAGIEDEMSEWLEGDLVEKAREPCSEDEIDLLEALTFWASPSRSTSGEPNLGHKLVTVMKKLVAQDVGKVEDIDRAVYATAGLMVKANGLLKEAVACAQGKRKPTSALIKVWKTAQNMRQYFMFGDVAAAVQSKKQLASVARRDKRAEKSSEADETTRESIGADADDDMPDGPPKLTSQRSLFAGAEDEVVREYADRITRRVNFLLGNVNAEGVIIKATAQPGLVRADSNREGEGVRWNLIARAVGSSDRSSLDFSTKSGDWKDLIERTRAAETLKDTMKYRRKVAERRKESKMPSASEKILKFVQFANMDLTKLETVIEQRDQRSRWRHKGLQLAHALLDSVFGPRALANLLAAIGEALRDTRRDDQPDTHVHYANGVEGVEVQRRAALEGSFMKFLQTCVLQLRKKLEDADLSNIDDGLADFALSVARVCTIDYDVIDHDILSQSGLPDVLPLLDAIDGDSQAVQLVRRAAWASTEILMLRCVGLQDQKVLPPEPTAAGQDMFRLFTRDLGKLADHMLSLRKASDAFGEALAREEGSVKVMRGFRDVSPASPGESAPHVPVGFGFTISCWVKRPLSTLEKREDFVQGRSAQIGDRVMQGPHWDASESPANAKARGTVTGLSPDKISVRWDGELEAKSYKWNDKDSRKVAVIDENYGSGTLFCKGGVSAAKKRLAWAIFRVDLLPDGSLAFMISTDEDSEEEYLLIRTSTALPAESWCHVAITCTEPSSAAQDEEGGAAKLEAHVDVYLNGQKDSETLVLTDVMLTPGQDLDYEEGEAQVWETPHPYDDNMDVSETIRIPGAVGYKIVFAPECVTEQTYDYLQFFKGENPSGEQIGLEKYTGQNFAPLTIEETVFTLRFVSDGSNHDWGVRMSIIPLIPKVDESLVKKNVTLNELPFYVGQPPQHICNEAAATARVGAISVFREVLEPDGILTLAQLRSSIPADASLPPVDSDRTIFLASLLSRCAGSMEKLGMTRLLSQPDLLAMTLNLCLDGPSTSVQLRLAAHRFAAVLVRVTDPEIVDSQYSIVREGKPHVANFVDGLLDELGQSVLSWVRGICGPSDSDSTDASGEHTDEKALSFAKVSILRGLIEIDAWKARFLGSMERIMKNAASMIRALEATERREDFKLTKDVTELVGALHVLGGSFLGVCPGVRAQATVKGKTPEPCTILALTDPPPLNTKAHTKAERKKRILDSHCHSSEERDAWANADEDLIAMGDAVIVSFNTDSNHLPYMLPATAISIDHEKLSDAFVQGLESISQSILDTLDTLVKVDVSGDVLAYEPNVAFEHQSFVHEIDDLSSNTFEKTVSVPGAESLKVIFDPMTRSENEAQFLRFYKDKAMTETWGTFSGSTWPGVAGMEPLILQGSSFFLSYNCQGDREEFPCKFTVEAEVKTVTKPPRVQPRPAQTVLKALRAHSIKATATLLRNPNCLWLTRAAGQIAPGMVDAAMEPVVEEDDDFLSTPKPVVLESPHPYNHNADDYFPVTFPPGFHMVVTFSSETRTENSCDYVKLYTNDNHQEYFGLERYTGGKDGGTRNWPGVDDNAPLVIESNHMVVYWHTDSSVNDWGWLMNVEAITPNGGVSNGGDLPLSILNDRIFHFTSILAEGHVVPDAGTREDLSKFNPKKASKPRFVPEEPETLQSIASDMEAEILTVEEEQRVAEPVKTKAEGPAEFIVVKNRRTGGAGGEKKILESAHPYLDNHDSTEEISFPGADSITIIFDPQTSTEQNYDWVKFMLRDGSSAHSNYEHFSGGRNDTAKVFPGIGDTPPLVVHADFVNVVFHTDGSNNDWGWKLTATPDYPTRLMHRPSDEASIVSKGLSLNQRVEVLSEEGDWMLVRTVTQAAKLGMAAVMESSHPYNDNEDVNQEVSVPGAAYLTVSFDEQTSTEESVDFLALYADQALTQYLYYLKAGADSPKIFSGGRGGSSKYFPGVAGLPPLRLRGPKFYYHWKTDASNTDWGWKLTAVGTNHSSAPPHNSETAYLYYRFVTFRVRQGGDGVQMQEFRFFDADGGQIQVSQVSAPTAGSPDNEQCTNLVEANQSKWFDPRFSVLVFRLASPSRVYSYQFVTANDCQVRDPTSWMLEASEDGEHWTCADDVQNAAYRVPVERHMPSQRFYIAPEEDASQAQELESPHPCSGTPQTVERVYVSGAIGFRIEFDERSSLAPGESGFYFYKDQGQSVPVLPGGLEKLDGGNGYSRNPWPGVGGNPPHVIYGDTFYYSFFAAGSPGQWGFKFRATPLVRPTEEQRERRRASVEEEKAAFEASRAAEAKSVASSGDEVDHYDVGVTGISFIPGAVVGWAKRRDADVEYLVSSDESEAEASPVVLIDPKIDDAGDIGDTVSALKNYLFEIIDDPAADDENGRQDSSEALSRPVALAKDRLPKIASSVAFTFGMATPKLAFSALSAMLTSWPSNVKLSTAALGGEKRFLAYVRLIFSEKSLHSTLQQRIKESVGAADGGQSDIVDCLLRYSLSQLSKAVKLSPLRHLKKTKCRMQTVETPHEYHNNMHRIYHVRLPGAKRIQFEFDPRCATEKDCDYLTFCRTAACNTYWGEQKYHGRNGSENFPGIGHRPPLVIEADEVYALFHSDGSNTDWGIKFTAYGILEEATEDEITAFKENRDAVGEADYEFACWILQLLAQNDQTTVRQTLCSSAALGTYRVFIESMPANKKAPLLQMLVPLLQELPKAAPFSEEQANAIYKLQSSLRDCTVTALGDGGAKVPKEDSEGSMILASQPPIVQALTQATLALDGAITVLQESHLLSRSGIGASTSSIDEEGKEEGELQESKDADQPEFVPLWDADACGSGLEVSDNGQVLRLVKQSSQSVPIGLAVLHPGSRQTTSWTFKLLRISSSTAMPVLGLVPSAARRTAEALRGEPSLGENPNEIVFGVADDSKMFVKLAGSTETFNCPLAQGDVLTVTVSMKVDDHCVEVLRNDVPLGLAVGPRSSAAKIQASLDLSQHVPAISMLSEGDEVLVHSTPEAADVGTSTSDESEDAVFPQLAEVQETSTLLQAFAQHSLPPTFERQALVSGIIEKCTQRIQLLGGRLSQEQTVTIPGAERLRIFIDGLSGEPQPLRTEAAIPIVPARDTPVSYSIPLDEKPSRGSGTEPTLYAFDGEEDTLWSGLPDEEGGNAWLIIDLEQEHWIDEFRVEIVEATDANVKLSVQSEADAPDVSSAAWATVGSFPCVFGNQNSFVLTDAMRESSRGRHLLFTFGQYVMLKSVSIRATRVSMVTPVTTVTEVEASSILKGANLKVAGESFDEEQAKRLHQGQKQANAQKVLKVASSRGVNIGDIVVRGPSWNWGDQDGGPGCTGEVTGFQAWRGKSGAGVCVKWPTSGHAGVYRWDWHGKFDLKVFDGARIAADMKADERADAATQGKAAASGSLREHPSCLVVFDSTVKLMLQGGTERAQLSVRIEPVFPKDAEQSLAELYPDLHEKILSTFTSGSLAHDGALVDHVNRVAKRKRYMSTNALAHCSWSDVRPDEKDLIRDACLRQLFSLSDPTMGEGDGLNDNAQSAMRTIFVGMTDDQEETFKKLFNVEGNKRHGEPIFLTEGDVVHSDGCWIKWHADIQEEAWYDIGVFATVTPSAEDPEGAEDAKQVEEAKGESDSSISAESESSGERAESRKVYARLNCQIVTGMAGVTLKPPKQTSAESESESTAAVAFADACWTVVTRRKRLFPGRTVVEIFVPEEQRLPSLHGIVLSPSSDDLVKDEGDSNVPRSPVEGRFRLIQKLNAGIMKTLPFVDFNLSDMPWSLAGQLGECRSVVFCTIKDLLMNEALRSSRGNVATEWELTINRPRARKFIGRGDTDREGRWSTFGQAFRALHPRDPGALRGLANSRLWTTIFAGEYAHDAGGPYNECWSQFAQELQSSALPLLVRTPNSVHNVGANRDRWLLNPGATTATNREMFRFLGKLMGAAARTKMYLSLNLAPIVWKLIVGEDVVRADLQRVDCMIVQTMDKMRHVDQEGISEEIFGDIFEEVFTTMSLDDQIVPLRPGGGAEVVTFKNRLEYADLVEQYRLHEMDEAARYVREGLATVLPRRMMCTFLTGEELEEMVCGVQEIDVSLLASVTEYSGCNRTDRHIGYFWEALESFDNEERAALLRFTWGRSRLPRTAEEFSQRFKIQSFNRAPADSFLPVAHTCFFSLELPGYSTLEIMKQKLRYAIHNCQAIDGDDTSVGMAAAALGWEAEE